MSQHLFPKDVEEAARFVLEKARSQGVILATAESCTGGLVAGALTDIAGSSDGFDRGFVTYSNAAKTEMLGVDAALIEAHGAVSGTVACAMAEGALLRSHATLAVAVTGIAGPGGGTAEKPVGLVHFAVAAVGGPTEHVREVFADEGREAVRMAAVRRALGLLIERL